MEVSVKLNEDWICLFLSYERSYVCLASRYWRTYTHTGRRWCSWACPSATWLAPSLWDVQCWGCGSGWFREGETPSVASAWRWQRKISDKVHIGISSCEQTLYDFSGTWSWSDSTDIEQTQNWNCDTLGHEQRVRLEIWTTWNKSYTGLGHWIHQQCLPSLHPPPHSYSHPQGCSVYGLCRCAVSADPPR